MVSMEYIWIPAKPNTLNFKLQTTKHNPMDLFYRSLRAILLFYIFNGITLNPTAAMKVFWFLFYSSTPYLWGKGSNIRFISGVFGHGCLITTDKRKLSKP